MRIINIMAMKKQIPCYNSSSVQQAMEIIIGQLDIGLRSMAHLCI